MNETFRGSPAFYQTILKYWRDARPADLQNAAKRWLWVAATQLLAVFMIHPLRNSVALAKLLGAKIHGVVCSDRWRIYERLRKRYWQVCWAHLKRNFQKQVDRGGKAKDIGLRCLGVLELVFELWHREYLDSATVPALGARVLRG